MVKNQLPEVGPGACLLARLDYGYQGLLEVPGKSVDVRYRLPVADEFKGSGGLVVRSGDLLLSWEKVNSNDDIWKVLASAAAERSLVVECRFPRFCVQLREKLKGAGAKVIFWENDADGSVPPLYQKLNNSQMLVALHLAMEWETGLAAARGGVGLTRFAVKMAREGTLNVKDLAESTGLSPGAVRSYLGWMEGAALVRKVGHSFALRHPLLAKLFCETGGYAVEGKSGRVRRMSKKIVRKEWDPVELD